MVRLLSLLLVLLLPFASHAAAKEMPELPPETTPAALVERFGAPQAMLKRNDRDVLIYPEFEVTFQHNRFVKLVARAAPPRGPETAASAPPILATTTAASVAAKSDSASSAPSAAPPAPITIGGIVIALWPFYLVITLIAIAPFVPALRRARRRWYYRHAAAVPAPAPVAAAFGQTLTPELMLHLEWKRFALLVQRFYAASRASVIVHATGPNGEITLVVGSEGSQPSFAVWCLPWSGRQVNASAMREFRGTMALLNQDEGRVITMGDFNPDAVAYGVANHITAISGPGFCDRFSLLPAATRAAILTEVTAGDFTTPTCPRCDVKLVRTAPTARFWSCVNAPRCGTRIYIR